jgi:hypothetical protein
VHFLVVYKLISLCVFGGGMRAMAGARFGFKVSVVLQEQLLLLPVAPLTGPTGSRILRGFVVGDFFLFHALAP